MTEWLTDEEINRIDSGYFDGVLWGWDEKGTRLCTQAKEANRLRDEMRDLSQTLFDEIDELERFMNRAETPQSLKHRLGGLLEFEATFAYRLARIVEESND